jgi:N-acetylmuramoyl-L-alanine amidase
MNIIERLIPTKYKRIRPQIKMTPAYITVHETDNSNKGADAEAHARFLASGNQERVASWHFTVDDKSIYQHVPTNEIAWHAGDGSSGTGNRKSIGVEICVNRDVNFTKAKANAVELIQYLMKKHAIPLSRVVPHQYWSGKQCPRNLLKSWSSFLAQIGSSDKDVSKVPFTRNLKLTSPMMRGDDVVKLQKRLQIPADGIFGPLTKQAVMNWQRVHDETGRVVPKGKGLVVDGIVGPLTWNALF